MSALARAREIGRHLSAGSLTAARMAVDDPGLLALQASRRLPRRLTAALGRAVLTGTSERTPARRVAGMWLLGNRHEATGLLPATRRSTGPARRLAAEIAVELGRPDLGPEPPGATRARAAWKAGDVTGARVAAQTAGSRQLLARYTAESTMLRPEFRVPVPRARPARASRRPDGPVALHLLTNSLPHTLSGYAARSHAVLRCQADAGVRVEAVTRVGYPVSVGRVLARDTDTLDDVTYRRLIPALPAARPDSRLTQAAELVAAHVGRFRPTVLHTTTHYVNGLVTRAVADGAGLPWVYEVRGQLEQTWVASLPTSEARDEASHSERFALLRAQEAAVAASADHVVTLSRTLRDDLVSRGVPAERITIVPNAVDAVLLRLDADPAQTRRSLGIGDGGFWVGTVSSLVDYEGLDTLIDAVALLRARHLDIRVALVGDGVSRPQLERRAHDAGIADAVLFPGRVSRDDSVRWHQALDVFAVPRRDVEVCRRVTPLKPIEAMALGRPVVASNLPALAEVLGDDGAGTLVPPGDPEELAEALATMAADPDARAAQGAAGRRVAAGRTWQAHGDRYRALYEQLVMPT